MNASQCYIVRTLPSLLSSSYQLFELRLNVPHCLLFSDTHTLWSHLNEENQVSHPHKRICKCRRFRNGTKIGNIRDWMQASVPRIYCAMKSFLNATFLARSQNCEKRLFASSCLSILLSVCSSQVKTRLPMDIFSRNLMFRHFSKISPENSSLIKIWHK